MYHAACVDEGLGPFTRVIMGVHPEWSKEIVINFIANSLLHLGRMSIRGRCE